MIALRAAPLASSMAVFLGAVAGAHAAAHSEAAPVAAPNLASGDTWVFERATEQGTSSFSSQRLVFRIERVGSEDMVLGIKVEGAPIDFQDHVVGLDWSQHKILQGDQVVTGRPFNFPMTVGESWTIDYTDPTRHGLQSSADHHETYKVVGWEDVSTPAGSFHALRIDSEDKIKAHFVGANGVVAGGVATSDGSTLIAHADRSGPHIVYGEARSTFYYVPSIKYWVKTLEEDYDAENVRTRRQTDTLVSFKGGEGGRTS